MGHLATTPVPDGSLRCLKVREFSMSLVQQYMVGLGLMVATSAAAMAAEPNGNVPIKRVPIESVQTWPSHAPLIVGGRTSALAGGIAGCGPQCDACWYGTPFENDCLPEWEDDGYCDCGCQFSDSYDCGTPECGSECDYCWYGTSNENNCDPSWYTDGTCDCGCQFVDNIDCSNLCPDPNCEYCWIGTDFENACDPAWNGDGSCDCGCQFDDVDCGGGGAPDLLIDSSSVTPVTEEIGVYARKLYTFAVNLGTGPANAAFDVTWYVSLDSNVNLSDPYWVFVEISCCMPNGYGVEISGSVAWPDVPPYNTPGQTYYIAVAADDTFTVAESNENNNWGQVLPVTLCDHAGDASGNGLVNLEDFRQIHACMSGPGTTDSIGCLCCDQDWDDDVDLHDMAMFQRLIEQR